MNAIRTSQNRRFFRSLHTKRGRFPTSLVLMSAGYLLGCMIGIFVAIKADAGWMTDFSSDLVANSAPDPFTVFCGFAAYDVGLLFLSTSYLGFFLIPGVFSVRGFLTSSVFTACVRGNAVNSLERACIALFLPDLFLLPGMLVFGQLCMRWSIRMLRCRSGEFLPPDAGISRELGAALVLLLAASAAKAYIVPLALGLT